MAGSRPARCQRFGMSGNGFLDVGYAVRDSDEILERVRRGSRCRVTMMRQRLGT